jgi:hypothetical protein
MKCEECKEEIKGKQAYLNNENTKGKNLILCQPCFKKKKLRNIKYSTWWENLKIK